jgi:uncharacterized protein YndB with AHSA1/START domain
MKHIMQSLGIVLGTVSIMMTSHSASAQKKAISITTTEFISASKQEVFDAISHLERYPKWSPFLVTDPEQKHHVTGEDGKVGSTFHWEGVAEKSEGYQTMASVEGNEYIRMECTILKPFKGNPTFEYDLKEKNGGIEVVQAFNLKLSGFNHFMTKVFGVEKKMTTTNELGLKRLKEFVEKGTTVTITN